MPYVRRYRKKTTRRYPRYRRSYRRRGRFSKKRFVKYSSKQKTVVRAPVNARESYVKLPWQLTTTFTPASPSTTSFALLGNSLVPLLQDYTTQFPSAGDVWAAGVEEYTSFYSRYTVLGSSIKIRALINRTGSGFNLRCVLIPVMCGNNEASTSVLVSTRINQLNALTYDQLCVQPYAQSRLITSAASSNNVASFKMFRKTKSMTAVKDMRDNNNLSARLPTISGVGGSVIVNADSAWFYYLAIINPTGDLDPEIDLQITMKFYTRFYGRDDYVPLVVPAS